MMPAERLGPDSGPGLGATLATAACVAISLYVAPALAEAYVSQLGFRPEQPGYVISAEMAGLGLATFPALWWLGRFDARRVARVMLVLMAAGNLLSMLAKTPVSLAEVRFATGLAGGTISIVCMTALRLTRDPNRSFALWLFVQLVVGAVVLAVLPALLRFAGVAGVFALIGVLAILLIWPAGLIYGGSGPRAADTSSLTDQPSVTGAGLVALGAVLAFYVAFSSLWALVSQVARAAGIASDRVGYSLALAPIGGIAGAALAAVLGVRRGGAWPLAAGVTILGSAIWVLGGNPQFGWYLPAALALMFAWTFTVPYLMGGLAAVDRSGRLTVAVNVIIGAGLALGPALGGFVLGRGGDYHSVSIVGLVLCIASFLLAIPMLRAAGRRPGF